MAGITPKLSPALQAIADRGLGLPSAAVIQGGLQPGVGDPFNRGAASPGGTTSVQPGSGTTAGGQPATGTGTSGGKQPTKDTGGKDPASGDGGMQPGDMGAGGTQGNGTTGGVVVGTPPAPPASPPQSTGILEEYVSLELRNRGVVQPVSLVKPEGAYVELEVKLRIDQKLVPMKDPPIVETEVLAPKTVRPGYRGAPLPEVGTYEKETRGSRQANVNFADGVTLESLSEFRTGSCGVSWGAWGCRDSQPKPAHSSVGCCSCGDGHTSGKDKFTTALWTAQNLPSSDLKGNKTLSSLWKQTSILTNSTRTWSDKPASINGELAARSREANRTDLGPLFSYWMAENLACEGRFAEAIELFQTSAKMAFQFPALRDTSRERIANCLWHQRKFDDAIGAYQSLLRQDNLAIDRFAANGALATILYGVGADEKAASVWREQLTLMPKTGCSQDGAWLRGAIKRTMINAEWLRPDSRKLAEDLRSGLLRRDTTALLSLASRCYFTFGLAGGHPMAIDPRLAVELLGEALQSTKVEIDLADLMDLGSIVVLPVRGWRRGVLPETVLFVLTRQRDGWEWSGFEFPDIPPRLLKDAQEAVARPMDNASLSPARTRSLVERQMKAPWPAGRVGRAGGSVEAAIAYSVGAILGGIAGSLLIPEFVASAAISTLAGWGNVGLIGLLAAFLGVTIGSNIEVSPGCLRGFGGTYYRSDGWLRHDRPHNAEFAIDFNIWEPGFWAYAPWGIEVCSIKEGVILHMTTGQLRGDGSDPGNSVHVGHSDAALSQREAVDIVEVIKDIQLGEGVVRRDGSRGLAARTQGGGRMGNYTENPYLRLVLPYTSYYLHLDGPTVLGAPSLSFGVKYSFVRQGDVLGYWGNTGRAHWPHLHFSLHDRRMVVPGHFRSPNLEFNAENGIGASVMPTPMDGVRLELGDDGACITSSNELPLPPNPPVIRRDTSRDFRIRKGTYSE